jgi:acyl-coenzyme A synthetase/AMP-(fatty) acid ligase
MRILDMIFYWAKVRPDHPAIIQPDVILTYKALAEGIESVTKKIAELNLNPQQPVAVLIEHPARQLTVCFALMHSGFPAATIYRDLLPHLPAAGIDTLIHAGKDIILPGGNNIRFDDSWLIAKAESFAIEAKSRKLSDKDGGLLTFTSGTTGIPKKSLRPAKAFLDSLDLVNVMGESEFSRTLSIPGVNGSFGFVRAWSILSIGKTICFTSPGESTLLLLSTYRIEYIVASPVQALDLVETVEKNGGYQLDSLKLIRIGGSLITKDLINRVRANLCPQVMISYGSTEAGQMVFGSYDMIANIPGAVGFVAPWAEVEIVDDAGNILPAGVEGRVRGRTPIFVERFTAENPDRKIDTKNLWWQSGDIGRLTEDGVLCIAGRSDDVLNRGGVSISAAHLDETLRSCPGIADAAVCGVWDDSGILEIWAGVVPQPDFDIDVFLRSLEQDAALKRKLDKNLNRVFVVARIPRTQVGKIQRNELREMLLKMKEKSQMQS